MAEENIQGRLIPVTKWPDFHPWPPIGGLRWMIFHAEKKGCTGWIVRKAGRVLINEKKFFEWAMEADKIRI